MKKKKESNTVLILFLLAIFATVGYIYYYKVVITRVPEIVTPDELITHTDEELKTLYDKIKMTYSEELVLTNDDITNLKTVLTNRKVSSNILIFYGIRQVPQNEYGEEPVTIKNGNYTYRGRYIKSSIIKTHLMRHFGINNFTNTTINAGKIIYVYDKTRDVYCLYENEKYVEPVTKVSYVKYDWDEKNIYVIEYSAYTKEEDGVKTSYTRHNQQLPIGITEKNIIENLDIIDEYKYTFTLNENVKKYFFNQVEYIDQKSNLTNE